MPPSWELLLWTIDNRTEVVTCVAERLAVRTVRCPELRLLLCDLVHGVVPGSEASVLPDCPTLAGLFALLKEDLAASIRQVAEVYGGQTSSVLRRVASLIASEPHFDASVTLECWLHASRQHFVENRAFFYCCD